MDPKLLLVKIVTLMFKESQLGDASASSAQVAKDVIATLKFPETGMDFDRTRESMQALRATALWMCDNPGDYVYERTALLQRIRVNVGDDEGLYYALQQGIEEVSDSTALKRQVLGERRELRKYLDEVSVKNLLKSASHKVMFGDQGLNYQTLVQTLQAELEPFASGATEAKVEGMVEEVDVSDKDSMADLMTRAHAEMSEEGVMRLGWQGLNRMMGDVGGLRRGESTVVGALQHNFKTGATLGMFKQVALYNKPYMRDPTKKPLLLHISLENALTENILWLYANLMENETGVECDLSQINIEEATQFVHNRLSAQGYYVKLCRMNPSDTTFHSLFDYIMRLEAEGFEIHLMVIDYLNMMSKKGCSDGPAGFSTRDLFRRVRNFTAPRGIAMVTPHQLSTEAKQLVRQGVENFVQEIANKGYYDSCKTIDQEVDLELYIHIVKVNGSSYLTVQRGKHRKVKITPDKDLFCVLPFSPVGGVRDDVLGRDSTRKHVGGGELGTEDEKPWWNTSAT